MHPLETYLRDLRTIRASGVGTAETSFYPALTNLLNEVGKSLRPRVRCILTPKNQGAGIPDGGLFTADQLTRAGEPDLLAALPARGVVEVKGTAEAVEAVADSEQVRRYLDRYGLVLVTNLRAFLLLGRDGDGHPLALEAYHLASSEPAFWAVTPAELAATPTASASPPTSVECCSTARPCVSRATWPPFWLPMRERHAPAWRRPTCRR